MRARLGVVGLLATVLLLAPAGGAAAGVAAATTAATAAAPSAPPEPVLVVPGGATDGQLTVRPATQAPDGRGHLTWVLANGGTSTVRLALSLHEVTTRDGRVEVGDRHGRLVLLDEQVALAPGEVARVRLPVPEDVGPGTVALVARAADSGARVTGLALLGGGAPVRARVADADAGAGRVTVRLDSSGPALVDVAVRAVVWPGVVRDEQVVTDVLVPAGGRDVPVAVGGAVAGPVTIEVAVSGSDARATRMVWWWPRWVPAGLAVGLLVATALLVLAVRRRSTGGGGAPS